MRLFYRRRFSAMSRRADDARRACHDVRSFLLREEI